MSKLGHLSKQLTGEVTFTILHLFWVTYQNNPRINQSILEYFVLVIDCYIFACNENFGLFMLKNLNFICF